MAIPAKTCKHCGAIRAQDADGFIKFRKPEGIPDAVIGQVVAAIYAELMVTQKIFTDRAAAAEILGARDLIYRKVAV
jgi:hypothetical protein